MSTYSISQGREALSHVLQDPSEKEVRAVLTALGLDVEPPAPKAGMYLTRHGDVLMVSSSRGGEFPDALFMCGDGGADEVKFVNVDKSHTMHPLVPVRFAPPAPAQPVTINEAAAMYEQIVKGAGTRPSFRDFFESDQFAILGLIDAFLRKQAGEDK